MEEFSGVDMGDARLNKRLITLADRLGDAPSASIPALRCLAERRLWSRQYEFRLSSAGVSIHGRVCTPGRLRLRGAVLRETPPPPRRPTFFFAARQRRRQENAPRLRGPAGCPPYGSAGRGLR